MSRRGLLAAGCAIFFATGCSDRGELITLVQRVELAPGVDALDPIDPTPVGQDWRTVRFFFTEPLRPSSAVSFNPALHLALGGLELDTTTPFFFNTITTDGIPPYGMLTLALRAGASGVPEGTYSVRLMSPDGNQLVGESGTSYLGTFKFQVSVVARDGRLPYLVRFRPQQNAFFPDELTVAQYGGLALFGGGVVPHGERIAPHAALRAEFSERMRTPLAVTGGPEIFVEKQVDTSFGRQTVLLEEVVGVAFKSTIEPVEWTDSIEGTKALLATVLTSETVEGLEISTDYLLEFTGAPPLTSQQAVVADRSGEPLTFRFADDETARKIALNDRRGFTTAPIRINSPDHRGFLNANAFLAGDITLSVDGEVADLVDPSGPVAQVNLALLSPAGTSVAATSAAPFAANEFNLAGVAIDRYQGTVAFPASGADGVYELRAEALAGGGSPQGADTIRLVKDTIPPQIVGGGDAEVLATDSLIEGFCFSAARDAVRIEVAATNPGPPPQEELLAVSTSFTEEQVGFSAFREFCFEPITIPAWFRVGRNEWTLRLFDAAGNALSVVRIVRIQPVIQDITPDVASGGDVVTVRGVGLASFTAADSVIFDGGEVPLARGFRRNDPSAVFGSIFVQSGLVAGGPEFVKIRVPDFAASGALAFRFAAPDGTRSTSEILTICLPLVGPFVEPIDNNLLAPDFVSDVARTGILPFSTGDIDPAGRPILVVLHANAIVARVFDAGTPADIDDDQWVSEEIAASDTFAGGASAAQSPGGTPHVAYVRYVGSATGIPGAAGWEVVVSQRGEVPGQPGVAGWLPRRVALHGSTGSAPTPFASVALAFAADGRRAVVYTGASDLLDPGANFSDTSLRLWAAIETAQDTGVFTRTLIDIEESSGQAISTMFDPDGNLWIAYNRDLHHAVEFGGGLVSIDPTKALNIEVRSVRFLGTARFVSSVPFSFAGLWPSIAIDPSGRPALAFQQATSFFFTNSGKPRADITALRYAIWNGVSWALEDVDFDFGTRSVGETPNPNLQLPRSMLRFHPGGAARVAFSRGKGDIRVANRLSPILWEPLLEEVTPEVGTMLSLQLDGAGWARLGYIDSRAMSLRLLDENDRPPLVPFFTPPSPCSPGRYEKENFAAAFDDVLIAHADFDYTLGNLRPLDAVQDGFGIFVTALKFDHVSLANAGQVSRLEVHVAHGRSEVTTFEDAANPLFDPNSTWIDRLEFAFQNPLVTGPPFGEVRLRARVPLPATSLVIPQGDGEPPPPPPQEDDVLNELRITAAFPVAAGSPGTDATVVSCCSSRFDNACTLPPADCFFPGVPGNISDLGLLGVEITEISRRFPLLPPPTIPLSGGGFDGTLRQIDLTLHDVTMSGEGDGFTPGILKLDVSASARLDIDEASVDAECAPNVSCSQLCGSPDLVIRVGGGDLRLRTDGPPGMTSRNDSARFGRPEIPDASGRGLVAAGDISMSISGTNDVCKEAYRNIAPGKIRDVLSAPAGDLATGLDELASRYNRLIVRPVLGDLLVNATDARQGVVLQVRTVAGQPQLRTVFEPTALPLPQP